MSVYYLRKSVAFMFFFLLSPFAAGSILNLFYTRSALFYKGIKILLNLINNCNTNIYFSTEIHNQYNYIYYTFIKSVRCEINCYLYIR